jgi:hypothetical protein
MLDDIVFVFVPLGFFALAALSQSARQLNRHRHARSRTRAAQTTRSAGTPKRFSTTAAG